MWLITAEGKKELWILAFAHLSYKCVQHVPILCSNMCQKKEEENYLRHKLLWQIQPAKRRKMYTHIRQYFFGNRTIGSFSQQTHSTHDFMLREGRPNKAGIGIMENFCCFLFLRLSLHSLIYDEPILTRGWGFWLYWYSCEFMPSSLFPPSPFSFWHSSFSLIGGVISCEMRCTWKEREEMLKTEGKKRV